MWSYSKNIWPNAQRNFPNASAFDEFRSYLLGLTKCAAHLGKRATRAQFTKRCAFSQMPRV